MRSVLQLLETIMENPLVGDATRTRAGFLHWRLSGGSIGIV
jgi:hypothetical protein